MNVGGSIEAATSLFGRSDFLYTKRTVEIKGEVNMPLDWKLAVRYYNGVGYGHIPMQTKYYFAGGSPLAQIEVPFYRSKGLIPSTIHDHALFPGDGNMRRYFDALLTGDKIDAVNGEARFPALIPFVNLDVPIIRDITRMFRSSLFFDAGRIAYYYENLWNKRYEVDWGFGIRLTSLAYVLGPLIASDMISGLGLYAIRVDFPLYVSMPLIGEEKFKYRWIVSLSQSF